MDFASAEGKQFYENMRLSVKEAIYSEVKNGIRQYAESLSSHRGTRDSSTTLADDLVIPPATSADSDSKN